MQKCKSCPIVKQSKSTNVYTGKKSGVSKADYKVHEYRMPAIWGLLGEERQGTTLSCSGVIIEGSKGWVALRKDSKVGVTGCDCGWFEANKTVPTDPVGSKEG